MSSLTKQELVAKLAIENGITQNGARQILESLQDIIVEATNNGLSVRLEKLGAFKIVTRKARSGRNPKTGDVVAIPQKNVLTFKRKK